MKTYSTLRLHVAAIYGTLQPLFLPFYAAFFLFLLLSTSLVAQDYTQLGLDLDGEAAIDNFGRSVSLSKDGNIVAIGAPFNGDNGSIAGHVRVYSWDGMSWVQRGMDLDGEAALDNFGYSVSLSEDGSIVAIGAPFNDDNGSDAGHVRVYRWDGTSWVQRGMDLDGETARDAFGWSVSLSGDGSIVAIGAFLNDDNGSEIGHVRVYRWDGTSWVQRGIDLDGEAVGDQSGYSVSLSEDGSIIAIGAPFSDGNSIDAGHVRVYNWDGTSWVQRGIDLDGEAAGDQSGWSVSLSGDGSIVVIGARLNDGNGSNAGHVRVYEHSVSMPDAEELPAMPIVSLLLLAGLILGVGAFAGQRFF